MKSERKPSEPAGALEFRASPIKAGILAAFGAMLAWMIPVVLMPEAVRFSWEWWAYVFLAVIAAWLLWEGGRKLATRARLTISPAGVTQTIWPWENTLAWSQVKRIDVSEARGMQTLFVVAHPPAKGFSSSGWNKTPYEIRAEIHEARSQWAGGVVPGQALPKDIVPPRLAGDRNRQRRVGMACVLSGTVLSVLGAANIRMMGPHERPPGVDFQWASPPTALGAALIVLGLLLGTYGFWRWLWPTGRPASPPIYSTLWEQYISVQCGAVLGVMGWLLVVWIQHPA